VGREPEITLNDNTFEQPRVFLLERIINMSKDTI
jgi:hypothetical protein